MRISPENWGPAYWKTFHVACLAAANRDELHQFIEGYKLVVPCGACRIHFSQILAENPLPTEEYFNWSVDIHNLVNASLGKRQFSYTEALDELQKEPQQFNFKFIGIIVILLIVISFLILNRK
jgi:hypothetical protein